MSFVDEAVKKTLDEVDGMDEEDVDAFAEEFARVCPGATADEFVGSVAAWVEDGTSHLYRRGRRRCLGCMRQDHQAGGIAHAQVVQGLPGRPALQGDRQLDGRPRHGVARPEDSVRR